MKRISELIKAADVIRTSGDTDAEIGALTYDSRNVAAGDCFFAVVGVKSDGHDFIAAAVERGARAVVCQRMPDERAEGVCYIEDADTNAAMADMAAEF